MATSSVATSSAATSSAATSSAAMSSVPHTAPRHLCPMLPHVICAPHCPTLSVPHTAPCRPCPMLPHEPLLTGWQRVQFLHGNTSPASLCLQGDNGLCADVATPYYEGGQQTAGTITQDHHKRRTNHNYDKWGTNDKWGIDG